ncbi:hypothetical protein LEP1GSC126_1884 [Leptospira kirschneri str. 200801774]|nr:hypothetical protein LEP1GSC126_1884 [Leptospira kirschneri str. 200801774]
MYDPSIFKKILYVSIEKKFTILLDHPFFEENSITRILDFSVIELLFY